MKQYIVDVFTDHAFAGNPCAVIILDEWLDDERMAQIARENRLEETSFAVQEENGYHLRYFTYEGEIDNVGHATLATAYVILNFYETKLEEILFHVSTGTVLVKKNGSLYEMDFPAYKLEPTSVTAEMLFALGQRPKEAFLGRDLVCVFEKEETVRSLTPDFAHVKDLPGLLVHVTAKGKDNDCVSRSFAPKLDILEDPVCVSGHCHLAPFWSERLNKQDIVAYQASSRGGQLHCHVDEGQVALSGQIILYSISELYVD